MDDYPIHEIIPISYKEAEDPRQKEYDWKQYLMQAANAGYKVIASFQVQHERGTYLALITERNN